MSNIELTELDKFLEMLKENYNTMKETNESMIRGMERLIENKVFDDEKLIYLYEQIKGRRALQEKIDQGIDRLKDISVLCADEATELIENCLDVYRQNFLIHKRMSEIMCLIIG
jgi:hypothetical protein